MSDLEWWSIEQKSHLEIVEVLRTATKQRPWAAYFLQEHPYSPGNLNSVCRIGFVPYDRCVQNRYYCIDTSRTPEILAAGGVSTQIQWDCNPETLPEGWQGAVRQSFLESKSQVGTPNTQVALLAFTTRRFRGRGLSGKVLTKMCHAAQMQGYRFLIVPALPPTQFNREHVRTPIEEIAGIKGKDGDYQDYWIRLHLKKGATVIGSNARSHRFIYSLTDFNDYVSSCSVEESGEHIVPLDKDPTFGPGGKSMWQVVYADVERSFVTFDWGCVWVQYDLEALHFDLDEGNYH